MDALKIENNFDFIISKLNIGDIRNNLCVIKFSDDTIIVLHLQEATTIITISLQLCYQNNSFFTENEKYHINIKTYRIPVAVNRTDNFGNVSSDGSHKTQYISEYATMGIFQEIIR